MSDDDWPSMSKPEDRLAVAATIGGVLLLVLPVVVVIVLSVGEGWLDLVGVHGDNYGRMFGWLSHKRYDNWGGERHTVWTIGSVPRAYYAVGVTAGLLYLITEGLYAAGRVFSRALTR